jgi:very-short-patch-repair endonuclease
MHTLGKSFGVDRYVVRRVLAEHNVVPRNQERAVAMLTRVHFDEDAAVERYLAGESLNTLSAAYGVHDRAVARAVTKRGGKLRTIGEANNLFHDQITLEQRRERATRHAVTWEGRAYPRLWTASPEGGRRRALALQSSRAHQKPDEVEILGMLPRGWVNGQQVAIDRYNIDFARGTVAVEIYSMGLHPFRSEQAVCRAIDLAERGWHVVYFWLSKSVGSRRVSAEGIAELVTRAEFLDRDPSERRQYLVIRGRGEIVTAGRFDTEQRTLVPAAIDAPETADRHNARIAS